MHIQFLVEDQSGGILVNKIMEKVLIDRNDITYNCKTFHGIGGFSKHISPKDAKTQKLLNDLPIYLRGFDKSINMEGYESALIIVLDNDRHDPDAFYRQLYEVAKQQMITIDYVFCLAIEEMEAWLLGDKEAILAAYPNARMAMRNGYVQDSICGTWETLANIVYPGGLNKMKKVCKTYSEIGKNKCEWAELIGAQLDIERNVSPSFRHFVKEVRDRIPA